MSNSTYAGIEDVLNTYFDNSTARIILMDETETLDANNAAIADLIAAEIRTEFGYQRQLFEPSSYSTDIANEAVVSNEVQHVHTASVNDPFSFDAAGILVGSGAIANVRVASVSGETITTSGPHGLSVGNIVIFTDATIYPTNMAEKALFYVTSAPTSTTLQVSATDGGGVVTFGSSFTGDLTARNATGRVILWQRRAGDGDVSQQIDAGASYTTRFRVGMKAAAVSA